MNVLREQLFNLAEGGFDAQTNRFADELSTQGQRTQRVLLALGLQVNASLAQQVFPSIVIVSFIGIESAALWSIQVEVFERLHIGLGSRS
jgi:hypothetical protein